MSVTVTPITTPALGTEAGSPDPIQSKAAGAEKVPLFDDIAAKTATPIPSLAGC